MIPAIASSINPILPGFGGAAITALQIGATLTSFSAETNPETTAQYSKFAPRELAEGLEKKVISSRDGMTLIYLPAFVTSSILYFQSAEPTLATTFVIFHFLKRLFEVFFVHKYSGNVSFGLSAGIGIYYALASLLICSASFPADFSSPVTSVGSALFSIGLLGNFYHHKLLADLRNTKKNDGDKYVVPKGGLFEYVAAPHYFFELLGWLGIAIVSQQANSYLVFTSMSSYLAGRSVAENKWNRSKFSEWPEDRKNIVPFVF